eukprot:3758242-Pyramimonas_sp.AAC.1
MRGDAISSNRKILLVSIAVVCLAVRHSQIRAAGRLSRRPRAHARFHSLRPSARFRVARAEPKR